MLDQAGSELHSTRRVPIDLDKAKTRRNAPEELQAGPLCFPPRLGLVVQVGVLRAPGCARMDRSAFAREVAALTLGKRLPDGVYAHVEAVPP
jgi:hypothetical protein